MNESVVLVEVVEAELLVRRWREMFDPVARFGGPAHITALFPFLSPDSISEDVLDQVREIASTIPPFDFELTGVDSFPGVIWLRPEPDFGFRQLTQRLWDTFPNFPPYEGRFDDSPPHLTIARCDSEPEQARRVQQIQDDLTPRLPLRCRASAISIFVTTASPNWSLRSVIPLG